MWIVMPEVGMGIRLALLATVFAGVASTFMDKVARDQKYDNWEDLILQYKWIIIFAGIALVGIGIVQGEAILPTTLDLKSVSLLLGIGLIGFAGIWLLFKGFAKLNPAIVLIIAQLNVLIMYFANMHFFGAEENLSALKIVLAVLFFLMVAQFLIPGRKLSEKDQKKPFCIKTLLPDFGNLKINKYALYPIGTAICRAVYGFANTYFVKMEVFSPIQSVFFTEGAVFIFAIIAILIIKRGFKKGITPIFKKMSLTTMDGWRDAFPYILIGLTQVVGTFLFYYAYQSESANMVNVVRLFQIIFTAVFAWVIFKQKLNTRSIVLMSISFAILLGFVLV